MKSAVVDNFFKLRVNTGCMLLALCRRGLKWDILNFEPDILRIEHELGHEIFISTESSHTSLADIVVTQDKSITQRMWRDLGLCVPEGEVFNAGDVGPPLAYARSLREPVVVKPSCGIHGHGITCNLVRSDDIVAAIDYVTGQFGPTGRIIIERYMPFDDGRVFVTRDGRYCALRRDVPQVVGNGVDTIATLAQNESMRRIAPRRKSSGILQLDDEVAQWLARSALTFKSIPKSGERIALRGTSNVMTGGTATDITDTIHPSYVDVARRALRIFDSLLYSAIDIMAEDFTKPAIPSNHALLEINAQAGIGVHVAPETGAGRDVADAILTSAIEHHMVRSAPADAPISKIPPLSYTPPVTPEEVEAFFRPS